MPASFNFPHTGKLLSLSFILFAGWFSGAPVRLSDYPRLALTGFLTFFGSLNAAVPFLLEPFRIPADTFQLFVATGVINSRFGTLDRGGAHARGRAARQRGGRRNDSIRDPTYRAISVIVTGVLLVLVVGGLRVTFRHAAAAGVSRAEIVYGMTNLLRTRSDEDRGPVSRGPAGACRCSSAIRARGTLARRLSSLPRLPFVFSNGRGRPGRASTSSSRTCWRAISACKSSSREWPAGELARRRHGRRTATSGSAATPITPMRRADALFSEPYWTKRSRSSSRTTCATGSRPGSRFSGIGDLTIGVPPLPVLRSKLLRARLPGGGSEGSQSAQDPLDATRRASTRSRCRPSAGRC